ncbi:MAG: 16S rRNA (guanine(966)-N(2))-methyltransferase RsmD [Myxococcales bacterium]|nr:16S rRNA (guanine(966)-N(2))-methyltransferase RsmD [Myxococcales bacterium]
MVPFHASPERPEGKGHSLRVTGGQLGGRKLRVPKGDRVRPTSDRVREAVFARIGDLSGARVLDAFAGSGALAIEALSRGAREAVLVERAQAVLAVLRDNVAQLALESSTRIVRGDARRVLERLAKAGERFDWIFLDPPYGADFLPEILTHARALLPEGGRIVLEASKRDPLPSHPGLAILDDRQYGDTRITRLGREPAGADQ